MIKVFCMSGESKDGCTWYRISQFARKAHELGLADVHFMDVHLDEQKIKDNLAGADVYIMRLNETLEKIFSEVDFDKRRKPLIIDIDDRYEDIDPLSNHYQALGTKNVPLPDGRFLWKDGVNINLEENIERKEKYESLLRRADAVIVTTFELRNYALQFNKNVVVIPNAIDPDLFPPLDIRHKTVNLTWSGGSSHYADLAEIMPIIEAVMKEYPQLHYHHVGQKFSGFLKRLPKDRTHYWRWVLPDGHGYRLACIGADIAIAPLKDMKFNYYKSSIKYYEYSALKIPTIAKNIPPYKDDIISGRNGLLYDTPEQFRDSLIQLIENPLDRITLAQNAYEYVIKNRSLEDITKDWVDFLKGVADAYKV